MVIAAWRAAATIGRAVSTALAQPETLEVVVVDDASGDDGATLAAARAADDGSGRLQVFALDRNSGPARARNTAIAATRAPWVCVLDSDDYLEPGRLAALLAVARQGYDFVADDLLQLTEGEPETARRPMWFSHHPVAAQDVSLEFFLEANLPDPSRPRTELGFLKPLMRRAFLDQHRLAYDETMRLGEDYDLYAAALAAGARFRLLPAAGYVAVLRPNSLSAVHDRKDLVAYDAADQRLLARGNLSPGAVRLIRAHRQTTSVKIAWIDCIDALKAGRLPRAAAIMLRSPRHAAHILHGLSKIVRKRLGLPVPSGI